MANQNVFLTEHYGNHFQHTVINEDNVPAEELKAITEKGQGFPVNFGKYGEFRSKAQQLKAEYDKAVGKVKASDNPIHTAEYKEYELTRLYTELEENSKAVQSEWDEERAKMQATAREKTAKAVVHVSQTDRNIVEQFADRLLLNVTAAPSGQDLSEEVAKAVESIKYLDDSQKVALQAKLPSILMQVEARSEKFGQRIDTAELVGATKNVSNMDLLAVKAADNIPIGVIAEFEQTDRIKRVNSGETRRVKTTSVGKV